ncbi:hypothetical protein B5C34_08590 [Pacificimonas flava]|uniref:Bacterial surface antigen (D15) domain-containing protein n=2 Tax=Pacificimonas TaxID=1960290 RepID=A0A219B5F4_9SPHN|nr:MULTISPECIES: BamA/TamA family outer membrane protein [Pacificimonas]MBZ6379279.1 BamA/TamA family outer membrane protein [Pacificimonas aurantium]OWV33511.1 hypothetical protein B5C34_08590 [Pacificimonas flava]
MFRRFLISVSLAAGVPVSASAQEPAPVPAPSEAEMDALLPERQVEAAGEAGSAQPIRYIVQTGTLARLGLEEEFRELSLLLGEELATGQAELNRRLRIDAETIRTLLQERGYYDALVTADFVGAVDGGRVELKIDEGPLYSFSDVSPPQLDIEVGDPVDSSDVFAAVETLRERVRADGYAFAEIGDPQVVVDHETATASLSVPFAPGSPSRFGRVIAKTGTALPFSAEHAAEIARFEPGDPYSPLLVEDLRRALLATGLMGSLEIDEQRAVADDTDGGEAASVVDIAIATTQAPPRTISGQLSYDSEDGARLQGSWQHRNLVRPEGALTLSAILSEQQWEAGSELRFSNWRARDHSLALRAAAFSEDRDAFFNRGGLLGVAYARETDIIWQKRWTWRIGLEGLFTQERDRSSDSVLRDYVIAAMPARLAYDGTDDLLDPTRGIRLEGLLTPEASFRGESFAYALTQVGASGYLPVSGNTVLALRGLMASIAGSSRRDIAPSRRLYAGGGGSVRGFGYQDVGPKDEDGDPLGGRSKIEGSAEARVRFGTLGAALFVDAGQVYTSTTPGFDDIRFGIGGGLRYFTSFGPVRADVAFPLDRRTGDAQVAFYVSLGQAF